MSAQPVQSSVAPSQADISFNPDTPRPPSMISAYARTEPAGYVGAASYGLKGFISEVQAITREDQIRLIQIALKNLKEGAVRDAYMFAIPGSPLADIAQKAGFAPCPDVTVHQRMMDAEPKIRPITFPLYEIRDGKTEDLITIGAKLNGTQGLSLTGWELTMINHQLKRSDRVFKVIEKQGQIVGIAVGGTSDKTGTLSHLWLAQGHRGYQIGQALCDVALAAMHKSGARSVHALIPNTDTAAAKFFKKQGFHPESSLTVLETKL